MQINEFLQTIQGLSPNTLRAYKGTLWLLKSGMANRGNGEPSRDEIVAFLTGYEAATTMHRHKAAVKAYLEFLGEPWPFTSRQFTVVRRRLPRYIDPDLIPSIADAGNDDDHMYVTALFTLGCRIQELMNITVSDITDNGVEMKTKGGYYRLKPASRQFVASFKEYAKGKKGRIFPDSYTYYYKRIKWLGARAGIEKISPHMLRHSRAIDLRRKGMTLDLIQQFLGHAQQNTTAIYLEIEPIELGRELEKIENNL